MTLVERRALAIWKMMMARESCGKYTVDVGWSEEDFVSEFSAEDNTTIILLEGDHYARNTVKFVKGNDALNIQLAVTHLTEEVERCSRGYPIFIYHDFVKHEVSMFQTEAEARNSQLYLIGNSLSDEINEALNLPSGVPQMDVGDKLVSSQDMLRFHYQDESIDYTLEEDYTDV